MRSGVGSGGPRLGTTLRSGSTIVNQVSRLLSTSIFMAKITPGLDFLGCNILLPGFSAFIVFAFIRRWLDLHFATWILVAVPVLVVSFHVVVRKLLTENAHAAEAARLGARLVPRGTQLDIFRILLGHLGYPSTYLVFPLLRFCWNLSLFPSTDGRVWELVEKYGPVLLGNNTIITTSPQHVKIILTTDSHNYVKGGDSLKKPSFDKVPESV